MSIVTDGLVLYLNGKKNNAVHPTLSDLSGNDRNATVSGAILQGDGSYLFDGVDDYMQLPIFPATTSYTIEAWLNYNKATTTYVICFGSEANGFNIEHSGGFTSIRISHNGQTRSGGVSSQNTLGAMAYYLMVYDAGTKTVRRWINDEEQSPLEFLADMNMAEGISVIGKRNLSSTSSTYGGYFASLRIYNRMLTPAEITQNKAVGVDVGIDDGGTDVSYTYATKQTVYADRSNVNATKQSVYADRTSTHETKQFVYANRDVVAPTAQRTYADRLTAATMRQEVYADRQTAFATMQRIYGVRADAFAMRQMVYAVRSDAAVTMQRVYADRSYVYPLSIRVYDPDAPVYEKTVFFTVSIKRRVPVGFRVQKAASFNAVISRVQEFNIRI